MTIPFLFDLAPRVRLSYLKQANNQVVTLASELVIPIMQCYTLCVLKITHAFIAPEEITPEKHLESITQELWNYHIGVCLLSYKQLKDRKGKSLADPFN